MRELEQQPQLKSSNQCLSDQFLYEIRKDTRQKKEIDEEKRLKKEEWERKKLEKKIRRRKRESNSSNINRRF